MSLEDSNIENKKGALSPDENVLFLDAKRNLKLFANNVSLLLNDTKYKSLGTLAIQKLRRVAENKRYYLSKKEDEESKDVGGK